MLVSKQVLCLLLLTSCVGVRTTPTPIPDTVQTINQGAAVLAGAELLALLLSGRARTLPACLDDAVGALAQWDLALAPQGLPRQALWVWDWPAMIACETKALTSAP